MSYSLHSATRNEPGQGLRVCHFLLLLTHVLEKHWCKRYIGKSVASDQFRKTPDFLMSWNVESDCPWSLVVVTWDFKFLGNYIKASVGASWICSNSFKTNKQGDREIKRAHCWWSGNSFLLNAKWPQRVQCLAVSLVFPNYTSQQEESLPQGLIPACQAVCRYHWQEPKGITLISVWRGNQINTGSGLAS